MQLNGLREVIGRVMAVGGEMGKNKRTIKKLQYKRQ